MGVRDASAVCYKPTSRLAYFASLGIPLVTYPFASYIDILVEFGYPLVAETLEEVRWRLSCRHCRGYRVQLAPATEASALLHDVQKVETGVVPVLQAAVMLDKLLASPQLRQEASEKLLEIAKFLSVDELAEQYEQALCQFLSPEV